MRSVASDTLPVNGIRHYAAYGIPIGGQGSLRTPFGFTSEQNDANELVYLRARHYAPSLGIFPSLNPFEGIPSRPMSLNGYSWVEGNTPNMGDPSGRCGQPTNWANPVDANCYWSAVGLAQRFSQGNPTAHQAWFDVLIQREWHELKAIEVLGSSADFTGSLNQFMRNSSILPSLFISNPRLALQAVQQWGCQNNLDFSFLGSFAIVGGTPGSLPGTTAGSVTIGGPLVLATVGGFTLAFLISILFAGTVADTQAEEDPCTTEKIEQRIAGRTVGQIVGNAGNIRPGEPDISRAAIIAKAIQLCRGEDIGFSEYFIIPADISFTDRILSNGNHTFVTRRLMGQSVSEIALNHLRPSTAIYPDLETEEEIAYYDGFQWATTGWRRTG